MRCEKWIIIKQNNIFFFNIFFKIFPSLNINIVKNIIPGIEKIELPPRRYAYGFNFKVWQEEYGFTIEEFLTNKKYIVISDSRRAVENIIDLGLFDWDNIEASSLTKD